LLEEKSKRVGFVFERFPAIDGLNLPDWLKPYFLATDGAIASDLAPGEIGCYASHLCIYERIVRDEIDCALILEDDVALVGDLMPTIAATISGAPYGWDYIHLSGVFKRPVLSLVELPNDRNLVRHTRLPVNTWAYLISRSGAAKMLTPGVRVRPIDMELRYGWLRDLDIYGVYPSPATNEDESASTISSARRVRIWSPGLMSEVYGWVYRVKKLGLMGYLYCRMAYVRERFKTCIKGEPRDEAPAQDGRTPLQGATLVYSPEHRRAQGKAP
jgi:glycosyl transferase family 25